MSFLLAQVYGVGLGLGVGVGVVIGFGGVGIVTLMFEVVGFGFTLAGCIMNHPLV